MLFGIVRSLRYLFIEFGAPEEFKHSELPGLVADFSADDVLEILLEKAVGALAYGLRFLW